MEINLCIFIKKILTNIFFFAIISLDNRGGFYMINLKRKRLNNKGFTLIELLAVVVILAVVMGIATTSVLTAMNKSRGGSLADTSTIIAQAFNQKYTESLVDGVPSNVYGGSREPLTKGYNFQSSGAYYLSDSLTKTFNISAQSYDLTTGADATAASMKLATATTGVEKSFIYFDATAGKFIVCMFATKTGSYYVDNFKVETAASVSLKDVTNAFSFTPKAGTVYACSDGNKSWQ